MSVPFPPLDIGIQAIQALTILFRRCRATVFTSSAVPRFTRLFSNRYMLLFPFPFGSRLVVHLGVIYPELRPPPVAILSVRDTAHSFTAFSSSLSNAFTKDAVSHLSCLHDTGLEPTYISVDFTPIDGMPVRCVVRDRTNSHLDVRECCRHLLFLFLSVDQVFS